MPVFVMIANNILSQLVVSTRRSTEAKLRPTKPKPSFTMISMAEALTKLHNISNIRKLLCFIRCWLIKFRLGSKHS